MFIESNNEVINIELTETNLYTRWPCHVCGGYTEKVGVLAEGKIQCIDGTYHTIRVCELCLEHGDIDARLELHALALIEHAEELRLLVGRLRVPTFAEWEKHMEWEKRVREFL